MQGNARGESGGRQVDRIELVDFRRPADAQFIATISNMAPRRIGAGLLRVVLHGSNASPQSITVPNAWPLEPGEALPLAGAYASMISATNGFHVAKVDVVDYLEQDGTCVLCGALVEFEGWRQVTRIRHQAH